MDFNVVAPNTTSFITVLSPNGGEKLEAGKTYEIKWTNTTNDGVEIKLHSYSGNNFSYQHITFMDSKATTYQWTVPNTLKPNNDYLIGIFSSNIFDKNNNTIRDYSDGNFEIIALTDKICQSICKEIGTRSEGWYDSCTGNLIKWEIVVGQQLQNV
ncbi:hypothetical protein HY750_02600 [Candidatus Kuenenbacteria bacterium]|nr:hypothetical protein [Candidatus Kuenenbacteria bacterium]